MLIYIFSLCTFDGRKLDGANDFSVQTLGWIDSGGRVQMRCCVFGGNVRWMGRSMGFLRCAGPFDGIFDDGTWGCSFDGDQLDMETISIVSAMGFRSGFELWLVSSLAIVFRDLMSTVYSRALRACGDRLRRLQLRTRGKGRDGGGSDLRQQLGQQQLSLWQQRLYGGSSMATTVPPASLRRHPSFAP
jgi:hypothetical protein